MLVGPRDPSGMALSTSSGLPAGRGRAWRRRARGGLGMWGALGRPHSYFDLLSLLSAPTAAFRSRAVKWPTLKSSHARRKKMVMNDRRFLNIGEFHNKNTENDDNSNNDTVTFLKISL